MRNPLLKGKPLVVCVFSGRTEESGVVSTANYAARDFGVRSGIPIRAAKAKLSQVAGATFLPMDMAYYSEVSEKAMLLIQSLADRFEQVGIDECYLDVSTQVMTYESAQLLASTIKHELSKETGITCSVGVAPNKLIAKIASDFKKPDGLTVVEPADVASFVSSLDVTKIPGIGPKTAARLGELGVAKMGELGAVNQFRLTEEFGKRTAAFIHNAARGIDNEPVADSGSRKQIARIATLKSDATSSSEMSHELHDLSEAVAKSAEAMKFSFRNVSVLLFLDNLEQKSRSKSLKTHTISAEILHSTASTLLDELMAASGGIKVRRLGVRIGDLQDVTGQNKMPQFMEDQRDRD